MPQNLFYWRSTRQREIDFVAKIDKQVIPIEVKYQESVRRQDTLTIRNTFGRGIILSKSTLDLAGEVKIVPLPLFLWLLKPHH